MVLIKDPMGLLHEIVTAKGQNSGLPIAVTVKCGRNFPPQMGPANIFEEEDGHQVTCVRCVAETCTHDVTFDEEAAKGLDAHEVRDRWPRLSGPCPRGCGYDGIAYASYMHYICGDW